MYFLKNFYTVNSQSKEVIENSRFHRNEILESPLHSSLELKNFYAANMNPNTALPLLLYVCIIKYFMIGG